MGKEKMGSVTETRRSGFDEAVREVDFLIERLNQLRDGDPISPTDLMMVIGILQLVSEYIRGGLS